MKDMNEPVMVIQTALFAHITIIEPSHKVSFIFFVSFPQKRNGIVFSSGVNYLHSGGNIQSELSS